MLAGVPEETQHMSQAPLALFLGAWGIAGFHKIFTSAVICLDQGLDLVMDLVMGLGLVMVPA